MSAEKVYINAGPDGKLSIGNQIIELKDESKKVFLTDNLMAFEKFIVGRTGEEEIYYSAKEVTLVPTKAEKNFKILATCTLQDSEPLAQLSKAAGADLSIVEFEKLLTRLRKYGSFNLIVSNLRAFSVAKKQTYERDIDNAGNYRLLIQREAVAGGNWVPPAKLTFAVPVFTYLEDLFTVEFDLVFSVQDSGQPVFRLDNLTFPAELLERRIEVLEARLSKAATCPQYWGTYANHGLDDSWKYRENKASL